MTLRLSLPRLARSWLRSRLPGNQVCKYSSFIPNREYPRPLSLMLTSTCNGVVETLRRKRFRSLRRTAVPSVIPRSMLPAAPTKPHQCPHQAVRDRVLNQRCRADFHRFAVPRNATYATTLHATRNPISDLIITDVAWLGACLEMYFQSPITYYVSTLCTSRQEGRATTTTYPFETR